MENPPKGPEDNKTIRNVLGRWAPASLRSKVVAVLYSSGLTVEDVTELSALRAALLILYNQKQSVMDDDSRQPHQKSLAEFPDLNQF